VATFDSPTETETARPSQRARHLAVARELSGSTRRRVAALAIREGGPLTDVSRRDATFRRSLALADVVAAGMALVFCVNALSTDVLRPRALLGLPLVILAGKVQGLYDRDELLINKTTIDQAPQLFQLATLYSLLVFLLQEQFIVGGFGSMQILALWGALFVFAIVARRIARAFARSVSAQERCLFVGSDESYRRLLGKLHDGRRATLVGRMALTSTSDEVVEAAATLHRLIKDLAVHRVVIEPSEAAPQATLDFVREAKATGARVSLLPRILEVVGSSIEVDDLDGLTLLGIRPFGLSRSSARIKRSFDAVGAAVGLVLVAPVLAIVALLIKRDSRGPVFYRQTRVGRDGRPFQMWKFRTMVEDADAMKPELFALNEAEQGLFKIVKDPRVTPVGRRLRSVSLDELPQLVNVVRGEMSLVGPRPLVTDEDAQITGLDRHRLQLTPGMTGQWQVLGGSLVPLPEMMKLDYRYVAGWSLWVDVKILLRTATYVLSRRGV